MQPSLRISHSSLPFSSSYSRNFVAQIVPLHAGDLAGLAADALAHIDQLGDLAGVRTTRLRRVRGGGRAADDVQRLQ